MESTMLYICAQQMVPHGSAGANRLLANAKSIQNAGIPVTVIGHGKVDRCTESVVEGIRHIQIPKLQGNVLKRAYHHLFADASVMCELIKKESYTKKLVVMYEPYYSFGKKVVSFCKKNSIGFCSDIVEWHQPFQFKRGKFDPLYRAFINSFNKVVPASGKVIAISEMLSAHFKNKGCDTVIIPPLVDCSEITAGECAKTDNIIRLIYTGIYSGKDDMNVMMHAISKLSEEEQKRIEFNLGVRNTAAIKELIERHGVKCNVVFHDRMSYDELLALYAGMDFLFLIREDTDATRANFPSKVPEMTASGISVIGSRVGDYHNFLTDGKDSILVGKGETEQVVTALKRVLAMSSEEISDMRKNARLTAETKFDYHVYSDIFKAFFERF